LLVKAIDATRRGSRVALLGVTGGKPAELLPGAFVARRGRRHRDLLEPERPPGDDRADRFGRGAATFGAAHHRSSGES
jgi:hypothetical protein